jgi:Polyketide cyclase / dehydrase and lipid transport
MRIVKVKESSYYEASSNSSGTSAMGTSSFGREIAITRTSVIPGSVADVFAFIAAEDVLPRVLTGYWPLPAVVKTSDITGPWNQPGSARIVHLADRTTVREQLTSYDAPGHFAYKVWDFGNPLLGALCTGARGEWRLDPHPNGTMVTWTYPFNARNAAAYVPLAAIARLLWHGYMDVCLNNLWRFMAGRMER